MYVYDSLAEMSVDSDRDSVIESEDGKEADVRPFLFHSFLCMLDKKTQSCIAFIYLLQHSDDDFNTEENEAHTNIKKVS